MTIQNTETEQKKSDAIEFNKMTIREALAKLQSNEILIPEMQRKFTWTPIRIEKLFDSIMRDYPINTFMFWNIDNPDVKTDSKFYEFIHHFTRGTAEDNPDHPTHLNHKDFWAVIDGQQRLTALLIGLCGTYTFKKGTKDNYVNEPRSLYIPFPNMDSNDDDDSDQELDTDANTLYENDKKQFNFQFFSKEELANKKEDWFKVGDILNIFDSLQNEQCDLETTITDYLRQNYVIQDDQLENSVSLIKRLYDRIFNHAIINYYLFNKELSEVLGIFVRTNTGGVQLNTADLLMSFSSAYWKKLDARKEMEEIINTVQNYGFNIDKNFILRTAYYILFDQRELNVNKLNKIEIQTIEDNWNQIKWAILRGFNYLKDLGFFHSSFSYSATALPIILFIYKNKKNPTNNQDVYEWLWLTLLKKAFAYKSYRGRLKVCKDVIEQNLGNLFPYREMIEALKTKKNLDIEMKEADIDRYLTARYNSSDALCILQILYFHKHKELPFNKNLHQDHIHPQAKFDTKLAKNNENYKKEIWDSVLNLQLLEGSVNQSKSDKTLKEWLNNLISDPNRTVLEEQIQREFYQNLYISELYDHNDSEDALEIGDGINQRGFVKFIEARRKGLKEVLTKILIKKGLFTQND